jgi:uncharacterized peroxidase-related enzyme
MSILRSHPGPLTLRDIFGLMPAHAVGIVHYYESVMRGPSPLSAAERELIYSYCSHLNGCEYAYTSHSVCATALGIDPAVFRAMKRGTQLPIRPQLKPILRFARKLTLKPSTIAPADARRIYAAGWPEQALIDTIVVTSLTAWINRVLNGFCAKVPASKGRAAGRALAEGGYMPVARQVQHQLSQAAKARRGRRATSRA